MAYPTIDAPYGLKPVNLIGGEVNNGATRLIPIASGYAANLFAGDVVKLVADGTLEKDTGTATATPVGVFVGCSYTDPSLGYVLHSQYFPTGTVASDILAVVVDNPDMLFKVAVVSSGSTMGGVGRTAVGNNASLVQNAGSTASGNSAVAVLQSTATTNTRPVRIVDIVPETVNASGNYTEVLVKWNTGMHQYQNATGV